MHKFDEKISLPNVVFDDPPKEKVPVPAGFPKTLPVLVAVFEPNRPPVVEVAACPNGEVVWKEDRDNNYLAMIATPTFFLQ